MSRPTRLLMALGVLCCSTSVANHKIYSPSVEAGEWGLELTGHRHSDSDADVDGQWAHQLDLEYAPLSWWRTELTANFEHDDHGNADTTAIEWENIFVLTQPGTRWLDAGLAVEFSHGLGNGEEDAVELGALLQKTVGRAITVLNIFAEREFGGEDEVELEYAGRLQWQWSPKLSPAVEIFGEPEDDALSIGPGAVGKLRMGQEAQVRYELACLAGASAGAADWTLRFSFELEI